MTALDVLALPDEAPGRQLYKLDGYATAGFAVAATLAAIFPAALGTAYAVFSCVLFVGGCVAFLWAYGKALERSRTEDVSVANVYGMSGVAPRAVQRRFHALTVVQVVFAIVAASIHPFTAQAFGILAPMLGLGLAGLWAARHGTFAERTHGRDHSRRQAKGSTANG